MVLRNYVLRWFVWCSLMYVLHLFALRFADLSVALCWSCSNFMSSIDSFICVLLLDLWLTLICVACRWFMCCVALPWWRLVIVFYAFNSFSCDLLICAVFRWIVCCFFIAVVTGRDRFHGFVASTYLHAHSTWATSITIQRVISEICPNHTFSII